MTGRRVDGELLRETYLQLLLRAAVSPEVTSAGESGDGEALANARNRLRIEGPLRDDARDLSVPVADCAVASVVDAMAMAIAASVPNPFEGLPEVPTEVSRILGRRGWAKRVYRADKDLVVGMGLWDQPPHVQSVRVGMLRELVRALLPDDFLDELGTHWSELTLPVDPGPRLGLAVSREVARLLDDSGIVAPEFPAHVVPYLESEGGLDLSTTGVPFEPYAGYGLDFGGPAARRVPASYFASALADYVVAGGHSGQGGTFWGFVVRGGGVFSSVQLQISGYDPDRDGSPRLSGRVIREFNRLLAPLQNRGRRELSVGVLFSVYRRDAHVVTKDRSAWIEVNEEDAWLDLPPGWGYAMVNDWENRLHPAGPPSGASEELVAAMEFLRLACEITERPLDVD
jgi:hypothetical protein